MRGQRGRNMVLFHLIIQLALFITPASASKLIGTSLDANWAHTSLIAEASEFLANEDLSGKGFWHLVENLIDDTKLEGDSSEAINHQIELDRALAFVPPLLSDGQGAAELLRFALALRLYSPRVQLHRQVASNILHLLPAECGQDKPFYELNGAVGCSASGVEALLGSAGEREKGPVYSIDHVLPSSPPNSSALPLAVLHADLNRPRQFAQLHQIFARLGGEGRVRYLFRHFDGKTSKSAESSPLVSLSGYGVELAIKSTEYKAIDDSNVMRGAEDSAPTNLHGFNFQTLRGKHVHLRDQLGQFQLHLAEMDELAPLKQWEIADIAVQAAQRVMEAPGEEALPLLIDLAQNFPIRARSLVQTKVRQSFREELVQNQQQWAQQLELAEGESAIWINGIPVATDAESLDVFQLFQTLRQEQQLAHAFMQLGLKRDYLSILRAMDFSEEKAGSWALDFREAKPEWLNNLDKDKQYADWGNSVRLLLQPYFPGMIRPIARNLFTIVCFLDPAAPESRPILRSLLSLYAHNVPLRIGFLFVTNDSATASGKDDLGIGLFNAFQFVKAEKSAPKALHFLQRVFDEFGDSLDLSRLHQFFQRHYSDQELDEVFGPGSDYDGPGRAEATAFFRRSGLRQLPALLVNGVPLDRSALDSPERLEEGVLVAVMRQTGPLQRAVMAGRLTDRENVQNWVMSQPEVLPRLNPRLIGAGQEEEEGLGKQDGSRGKRRRRRTAVHSSTKCGTGGERGTEIGGEERTDCVARTQRYLVKSSEDAGRGGEPAWLTVWLVADLGTAKGRELLRNGLKALKKSPQMRLGLVHNGGEGEQALALLVDALLARLPSNAAKQALNKLLGGGGGGEAGLEQLPREHIPQLLDSIGGHGLGMEQVLAELAELDSANGRGRLALHRAFASRELGLAAGECAVLVNGQFFGPLEEGEQLEPEDFGLMEKLAERRGAREAAKLVAQWAEGQMGAESVPDTLFRVLSAVNSLAMRKGRKSPEFPMEFESVLNLLAADERRPVLEIVAILDPLSRASQKLAPILATLLKVLNADLRLAMNPRQRLSELPLKRFYRYVLREEPQFGPSGQIVPNVAQFQELPQKQLLTMNLIVPDAWMVQPVQADIDLDNIRAELAPKDVLAQFRLSHVLLEGHCFDQQSGNPPRGLQFVLGTPKEEALFDTTVMANLGYFQLKASPGAWILRLRQGRSKEVYELKGAAETEEGEGEEGREELEKLHILVDSFSGKTVRVRVAKRRGMEGRNLLAEEGGDGLGEGEEEEGGEGAEQSIWMAPKKAVKKLSSKLLGADRHEAINIFSLASGHLYERFLRIMMLSVLKHTRHPVKFWLLNNYLSPQFRESLPVLAEHYGFQYELIEYKWPRWLHQQTEKQRVMWGYKILFLDVLFPLDVKKIIFVDADQVVRADMMDLMEHDLEGAPYGYTPFCESRTSMDGFRFWKSGYWASHLAGRKYHISALYVVDLIKFRRIAAGDRLRGQYQGLSADPNSLSNLDQDLPNNMIHQVRVHSLPQEWLWCETWCDDASKEKARTIDLCNNPQTKEPKLDSAMRILPEWMGYDEEIRGVLMEAAGGKGDGREEGRARAEADQPGHGEL